MTPLQSAVAGQLADRIHLKNPTWEGDSSSLFSSEKELREQLKKFLGIPYRWGGASKRGLDCSGLTKCIYSQFLGIDLPHNSVAQSRVDGFKDISPFHDKLKMGDLLFFGPRKKGINHVGMYLSDGKFIHASRRSGVNISSLNKNYWKSRLIASKRVKDSGFSTMSDNDGISGMRELLALSGNSPYNRSMQSVEMGYSSPLLSSINLNIDTFVRMTPLADDPRNIKMNLRGGNQSLADTTPDFEARQGVRVFTDLTLFKWLTITPSFTRLNDRGLYKNRDEIPVQILGLDTVLKPKASRWSLAMTARTWSQKDYYDWQSGATQDVDSLEVGFGLGLHVTNSFKFSLIGMGRYNNYDEMQYLSVNDSRLSPFISNVAFKLDFAF